MSLWWGSDPFADLVAKATSELLPAGQEDIALNLEICDKVRAKQVQPKQAMQVIKKRISDSNPNVVLLALGLVDICIKNGGDHFLAEVASREFMDNLVSVLKKPTGVNHDVKAKALRLIQEWAQISEAKPATMSYIIQVYRTLQSEPGFAFPTPSSFPVSSAAFVETLTAPEWVDGEVCMRCRTQFTTFNRKHHCRNCGNVFCQQCSSHNMSLPWYGVGQDVRVCDGCYNRKAPPKNSNKLNRSASSASPHVYPTGRGGHQRSATLGSKPSSSSRRSRKEDDDLALAIKLSLQDSGGQPSAGSSSSPSQPTSYQQQRAVRQPNGRMLEGTDADDDPDLAAAIAASLRDYMPPQPSAPLDLPADDHHSTSTTTTAQEQPPPSTLPLPPSLDLPPSEIDSILTFSQSIQRQPHHPQNQVLFEKAIPARPKMIRNLEEANRRRGVLYSMNDKLSEIVKIYDQLLDSQLNGGQQQQQQGYYRGQGSPDPFVRQRQYEHQHYQHHQQQQENHYGQGQMNGYHEQATNAQSNPSAAGNSMYPSLPPTSNQSHAYQHPQHTGSSAAPVQQMYTGTSQSQPQAYNGTPQPQQAQTYQGPMGGSQPQTHLVGSQPQTYAGLSQQYPSTPSIQSPTDQFQQPPSHQQHPQQTAEPQPTGLNNYLSPTAPSSVGPDGYLSPSLTSTPSIDPSTAHPQYPIYDYNQFAPQVQPPPQSADLNNFQKLMSPPSSTGDDAVQAGIGAHGGVYSPGKGPNAQPFRPQQQQQQQQQQQLEDLPSAPTNAFPQRQQEWKNVPQAEVPALIDL
ncbi:unnamed protein product [Sympodiomycopsis kandeliae]